MSIFISYIVLLGCASSIAIGLFLTLSHIKLI